jgi:hypothetical protein
MNTPATTISEMPFLSQGSNDESVLLSQVAGLTFPTPELLYRKL